MGRVIPRHWVRCARLTGAGLAGGASQKPNINYDMPDFASVTCLPHNLLLCALFVVCSSAFLAATHVVAVREFLTRNQGLRIPDRNWDPLDADLAASSRSPKNQAGTGCGEPWQAKLAAHSRTSS